jgi:RNA polymerase sigma-70 factor, ECF subfamily
MDRLLRGDAHALAELYDRHARTVYSLALRVIGDHAEAEDIVQDVFTQAWRHCARYDGARATVAGWLVMMTRSRAIDRLRARQSRPDQAAPPADLPDTPSGSPTPDTLVMTSETVAQVRIALGGLPPLLRTPIEMAYYEGLSQSAIAEKLGEPLGTVKTRMRTALQKLRAAMQGERAV